MNIQDISTLWILIKIGGREVSDFEPEYNAVLFFEGITFVANATVVMSSFTVFLEMVCHVGSSQELAANFAGDFVLVACKVRAETISCGKRGITNLKDRNHCANASHRRKKKKLIRCGYSLSKTDILILPGTCGVSLLCVLV